MIANNVGSFVAYVRITYYVGTRVMVNVGKASSLSADSNTPVLDKLFQAIYGVFKLHESSA
jgi:hypothetical protein